MTIEELRKLEHQRVYTQEAAREAAAARNAAILVLLGDGVSQTEIARALGLTPGRISQIARVHGPLARWRLRHA